jgi:molybdate transport system substrate-binding protein
MEGGMVRRVLTLALVVVAMAIGSGASAQRGQHAAPLTVMTSGAFAAAQLQLGAEFERSNKATITTVDAPSMGSSPDSIPSRLKRGEPVDVVIMSASGLDDLIKQGSVVAGSRVDLARSAIGVAVRAGAPKPDISSAEALKNTLLRAKSIAISSSISGVYISNELVQKLGIADQVRAKIRTIDKERVGSVVARGDADIGFQQVSELLPVSGIDYLGPLPAAVQRVTLLAAGVGANAREPEAARAYIGFLASPAARPVIKKSGLEILAVP